MSERAQRKPTSNVDDEKYALEHVTSIAVQLLIGDQYVEAGKKAISLLDACRTLLEERAQKELVEFQARERLRPLDAQILRDENGEVYQMPWEKALAYITDTGQGRRKFVAANEYPRFKRFLSYLFQASQANRFGLSFEKADVPSEASILARVDKYKKEGISTFEAHRLKLQFEPWKVQDKTRVAKENGGSRRKKKAIKE